MRSIGRCNAPRASKLGLLPEELDLSIELNPEQARSSWARGGYEQAFGVLRPIKNRRVKYTSDTPHLSLR